MDTLVHNGLRYLRIFLHWAWLIILGGMIAGGISYYVLNSTPPKYEADATLMVGQFIRQATPDQSEIEVADKLAVYYRELLHRSPVLEGVRKETGLRLSDEDLIKMAVARVVPSTAFVEIAVVDSDPTNAVRLVNAFAHQIIQQSPSATDKQLPAQRQFIQQQLDDLQNKIETARKNVQDLNAALATTTTAGEIADVRAKIKVQEEQIDLAQTNYINLLKQSGQTAPNTVSILEESKQARRMKTINPLISVAIATLAGLLLAMVCAVLLEYLDDRVRTRADLAARLKIAVLGFVPHPLKKTTTGTSIHGDARQAQAYELIASNVVFGNVFGDRPQSVLVTAPGNSVNLSAFALDLSIAVVNLDNAVLLVEANTRQPQLHTALGVANDHGFHETFYGKDRVAIGESIQSTLVPNLYVMTAGTGTQSGQTVILHPNIGHIRAMSDEEWPGDFVVFCGDDILSDKTTRMLVSHVGTVLLVCELGHSRYSELREAIQIVERMRGSVVGIVAITPSWRAVARQQKKKQATPTMIVSTRQEVA